MLPRLGPHRLAGALVGAAFFLILPASPTLERATCLGPATASAQNEESLAKAKEFFRAGKEQLDAEQYAEAASSFQQAYALSGRPELLYYTALSHEKAGALVEAQEHYQRYLDEMPDAPNAEDVLDKIIEIQQRISKEMARVVITTTQEGRDILVDREQDPRCQSPCTLTLQPGAHTVRARVEGAPEATKQLRVNAGETQEVSLSVNLVKRGRLLISTDVQSGVIRIAGRTEALPMIRPIELEEGRYDITLESDGAASWQGNVTIEPDDTTRMIVPLAQQTSGPNVRRLSSYIAASAGVGLIIGGVLMGAQARDTFNLLEDRSSAGAVDQDLVDQGKSQQRAANVLLISGATAVGAGVGLFAWDIFATRPKKTAPPSEDSSAPAENEDSEGAAGGDSDVEMLD